MSSGFGEIVLTSTFRSRILATSNYTLTGAIGEDMDDTYLLAIILLLCVAILVLVVCGVVGFCFYLTTRRRRTWKHSRSVHSVLVSKSTSITGLNCDRPSQRHAQVQAVLEGETPGKVVDNQKGVNGIQKSDATPVCSAAKRLLPVQQKLVTSTPTAKLESMIVCGTSGALVTSPQSTIYDHDFSTSKANMVSTCTSPGTFVDADYSPCVAANTGEPPKPNFTAQSPLAANMATEWATGHENLQDTVDSAPAANDCYGTAHSGLLQDVTSSRDTLLSYPDASGNAENTVLLPNDCSFLESPNYDESPNSNGVTTSLPLDAYGHPRAWFVPLDELYHEPIRHSFIDVSGSDLKVFANEELSKDKLKGKMCAKSAPVVGKFAGKRKHSKECMQYDVFDDRDLEENSASSWRDSGIPTSHSRVRSSNSSDSEGKKLSAWEQREDRPVLFIEESGDNAITAEVGH